MAKGNIMTGTLRGKVGDFIFSRQGGEQRSRAYIPIVSNPKTRSQMQQRTQLANLVAMYRTAIRLFPSAFSNKKSNRSDYNEFVGKNLGGVSVYLTKEMVKYGTCIAAPYQITAGSLPSIQVSGEGVDAVTNIKLPAGFEITEESTVADVSAAILQANPSWQAGQQLAYISVVQETNIETGYPYCYANLYSMTLNVNDGRLAWDMIPAFGLSSVDGFIGHGDSIGDGCFAWVKSSIDANGKINVSTQRFIVTSRELYAAYSDEAAKLAAMASYNVQDDVFLNPKHDETADGSLSNVLSVSSVQINSVVLKTSNNMGAMTFSQNDTFTIAGTNLSSENLKVAFNSESGEPADRTAGAQSVEDLMTISTNTASRISGALKATSKDVRHVYVFDGSRLVYSANFNGTTSAGDGGDAIG